MVGASQKLVICIVLFSVFADIYAKEHKIKKRHLSDEERKAAYKAALPENRRKNQPFDPKAKVDRDDIDHERSAGKNTRQLRTNEYENDPQYWISKARDELNVALARQGRNKNVAKNVILIVGDGMNMPTVTSGRVHKGHLNGKLGADEDLEMDLFPHSGLSKTYSVDYQTADSAATATALMTGAKTKNDVIGLTATVEPGTCAGAKGNELKSVLEESHEAGKSVGIVTTDYLTESLAASTYAKTPDRHWYSDADLSDEAKLNGCKDIAFQLYGALPDIDVVFGGGRKHFRPSSMKDEYDADGKYYVREDGQDLIGAWESQMSSMNRNAQAVFNKQEFDTIDVDNVDNVWGMFSHDEMAFEIEKDTKAQPTFSEMVEKAIKILQKDEDGFFLVAESGLIDIAHQRSNAHRAITEFVELDKAVGIAKNMTSEEDTLIIVTGDHGHTFNFGGYAGRGNSIFGLAPFNDDYELGLDGKPYTTLLYGNGPGFQGPGTLGQSSYTRQALTPEMTEEIDYLQQSAVPLNEGTNGADDIPIYASGPMAHLIHKTHQQSYIGHVIRYASCIGGVSSQCDRVTSGISYSVDPKINQYANVETRETADEPAPIESQSVNFLGHTLDKSAAEGALWAMFVLELLMTFFIVVTLGVYTCKH